jgi:hypothetical protein
MNCCMHGGVLSAAGCWKIYCSLSLLAGTGMRWSVDIVNSAVTGRLAGWTHEMSVSSVGFWRNLSPCLCWGVGFPFLECHPTDLLILMPLPAMGYRYVWSFIRRIVKKRFSLSLLDIRCSIQWGEWTIVHRIRALNALE